MKGKINGHLHPPIRSALTPTTRSAGARSSNMSPSCTWKLTRYNHQSTSEYGCGMSGLVGGAKTRVSTLSLCAATARCGRFSQRRMPKPHRSLCTICPSSWLKVARKNPDGAPVFHSPATGGDNRPCWRQCHRTWLTGPSFLSSIQRSGRKGTLDNAPIDWPLLSVDLRAKKLPRKTPTGDYVHQGEAMKNVVKGFNNSGATGQMIMACGTAGPGFSIHLGEVECPARAVHGAVDIVDEAIDIGVDGQLQGAVRHPAGVFG